MFAILLPTTFEIARSLFPSSNETKLTTNSGADVPNATTVSPITRDEIPNFFATLPAPSTKKSAHLIKSTNQITNKKYVIERFL